MKVVEVPATNPEPAGAAAAAKAVVVVGAATLYPDPAAAPVGTNPAPDPAAV